MSTTKPASGRLQTTQSPFLGGGLSELYSSTQQKEFLPSLPTSFAILLFHPATLIAIRHEFHRTIRHWFAVAPFPIGTTDLPRRPGRPGLRARDGCDVRGGEEAPGAAHHLPGAGARRGMDAPGYPMVTLGSRPSRLGDHRIQKNETRNEIGLGPASLLAGTTRHNPLPLPRSILGILSP